jgi:galactokinase
MGNHVDFQGGVVLPVALQLETRVDAVEADRVRLTSEYGEPVDIAADGTEAADGWGGYVGGVVAALAEAGRPPVGIEGRVTSTVPLGAGLSSSASLTVSVAVALSAAAGWGTDALDLARRCRQAENEGAGVACGIMDPLTAVVGSADGAVFIDCRDLTWRPVAVPTELAVVVADSGVTRQLGTSGWADRKADVQRGTKQLGVGTLRDVTVADLEPLPLPIRKRCRHVVTEIRRAVDLADVLPEADRSAIAELFAASHRSDRDDYEASHPAVDALVDRLDADSRVIGARMTGGGFGGVVVAIVEADVAVDVVASLGSPAWVIEPSPGASLIS